jgi:hypothetical protein
VRWGTHVCKVFGWIFGADSILYFDEDFGLHFWVCRDGICDVEFGALAFHVSVFYGEDILK